MRSRGQPCLRLLHYALHTLESSFCELEIRVLSDAIDSSMFGYFALDLAHKDLNCRNPSMWLYSSFKVLGCQDIMTFIGIDPYVVLYWRSFAVTDFGVVHSPNKASEVVRMNAMLAGTSWEYHWNWKKLHYINYLDSKSVTQLQVYTGVWFLGSC